MSKLALTVKDIFKFYETDYDDEIQAILTLADPNALKTCKKEILERQLDIFLALFRAFSVEKQIELLDVLRKEIFEEV